VTGASPVTVVSRDPVTHHEQITINERSDHHVPTVPVIVH